MMRAELMQTRREYPTPAKLMEHILEVRYTDLELERDLCKQLLDAASIEQDSYASAFANVYLFDSLLAMGDNTSCDYYLARASDLCREHHYDGLLLTLCNLAGLYYSKLGNEQSTMQYYLEGLGLASQLSDPETECKLLNNIGAAFAAREDWSTAKEYLKRACEVAKRCGLAGPNLNSYLCNLGEVCCCLGDHEAAEQALRLCSEQRPEGLYHEIRLTCAWCSFFARTGEYEKCIKAEEHLREINFLDFENRFFVYDMCLSIGGDMLDIGDEARAWHYLSILEAADNEVALLTRSRILHLKIRFWERKGNRDELGKAYREYYELELQMNVMDDQAKAQSMLSQIQLMHVRMEREAMHRKNRELEHASQLDQLTGLYNRRYFNKLISKITQSSELRTLGFIMLDVDYFKQYNDRYGHQMGDQALKAVAEALSENTPPGVYASRYGGDEFVCICANMTDEDAEDFIIQIETALRRRRIPHENSKCCEWLSLSIGWCNESFAPGSDTNEFLDLADQALYLAKERGRGQHGRKQRGT